MTDQEKIVSITTAIQDDTTLLKLMKSAIAYNLQFLPSSRLDAIMTTLNLPNPPSDPQNG